MTENEMVLVDRPYTRKEACCGCTACYSVCPSGAIRMEEDEEGFLYPKIELSKCSKCNKCRMTCSFAINQRKESNSEKASLKKDLTFPIAYAMKHKDNTVRQSSRSGGLFTAVSDIILDDGGSVYGCVLGASVKAEHIQAIDQLTRDRMRGSKYVQSDMRECFHEIRKKLSENKKILFTGTTCQVEGLLEYAGRGNDNLITMDILCHGVVSPKVLQKYIEWQSNRNKAKIININFRNKKKYGWRDHVETLCFDNGREVDSRVYTSLFYSMCFLRPSCYECPYKNIHHSADITAGDFWGIEKIIPAFDDNQGVSLLLVNTEKGINLLKRISDKVEIRSVHIEECMQEALQKPSEKPDKRDRMWEDINSLPFKRFLMKDMNYGRINTIKKILFSRKQ